MINEGMLENFINSRSSRGIEIQDFCDEAFSSVTNGDIFL